MTDLFAESAEVPVVNALAAILLKDAERGFDDLGQLPRRDARIQSVSGPTVEVPTVNCGARFWTRRARCQTARFRPVVGRG